MATQHTSLATKYRPHDWDTVCGQRSVLQILKHQVDSETFKQAYLMAGRYGSGKTTVSRILAQSINGGNKDIVEIDAASHNGVEHARALGEEARRAPLAGRFRIFIIDECHLISAAAWGAWLKILEEPPASAIFIFATTDPQKIPNTILSRVQRYTFTNIPLDQVQSRLRWIAQQEGWNVVDEPISSENKAISSEAINYIAKLAEGGMRDAIASMDKCMSLSCQVDLAAVTNILAVVGYADHLALMNALVERDTTRCVQIIANAYNQGKDLKQFMSQFMWAVCDTCNYFVFQSFSYINIPELPEYKSEMVRHTLDEYLSVLEWAKQLNADIRTDSAPKNNILVEVMLWCQGQK